MKKIPNMIQLTGRFFECTNHNLQNVQTGDIGYAIKTDSYTDPMNKFHHVEVYVYSEKSWRRALIRSIIDQPELYQIPTLMTLEVESKIHELISNIIVKNKGAILMWDGKVYKN